MRYLNLGCGSQFHPDWTNIDITSSSPYIQAHDLRQGIPYSDDTFEVVYHSHLLEHFPKHGALGFMRECYRVLTPGGIIRVVVPDLERMVQMYLQALDKSLQGENEWHHHYEWMMLELYDQAVREHPGGATLEYLKQDPIPNEAFVYGRWGSEALRIVQALQTRLIQEENQRLRMRDLAFCVRHLLRFIRKQLIKRLLSGDEYKALQIGLFRLQGEVHQWMYDRYSLARLLEQAGFQDPSQRTAFESAIESWVQFNLDTKPDGTISKPDSLYMEAVKLVR